MNTPEDDGQTDSVPENLFDKQLWWDNVVTLADGILEQIGYDHSSDNRDLWSAQWPSYDTQKEFQLQRRRINGRTTYWLSVCSYIDRREESGYILSSERGDLSASGIDVAEAYNLPDRNGAMEFLSKKVLDYLRTSGIKTYPERSPYPYPETSPLTIDEEAKFQKVIVTIVASDSRLVELVKRVVAGQDVTDEEFDSVISKLKRIYSLDEDQAFEAMGICEQIARRTLK